jgi:hypothetical protein
MSASRFSGVNRLPSSLRTRGVVAPVTFLAFGAVICCAVHGLGENGTSLPRKTYPDRLSIMWLVMEVTPTAHVEGRIIGLRGSWLGLPFLPPAIPLMSHEVGACVARLSGRPIVVHSAAPGAGCKEKLPNVTHFL